VAAADDLDLFSTINNKLLKPPGVTIRHVPMKIYLPMSASQGTSQTIPEGAEDDDAAAAGKAGHIRVVQSLVPLHLPSKQPQTLGTALNGVLQSIFPSRRSPLLAQPVLHGAVAPMNANLEELGRVASSGDGFLHVAVVMMS
jgi:autophagy-related protein 5